MDIFFTFFFRYKETNFSELPVNSAVAKDKATGKSYLQLDFADLVSINDNSNAVVINLKLKHKIQHTFPKIDRCCKLSKNGKINYDGIDNMKRINCNISKKEFANQYIRRREPVLLTGCQNDWTAKNWNMTNIFERFLSKWPVTYYSDIKKDCYIRNMNGLEILNLIAEGFAFKAVDKLPKSRRSPFEKGIMLEILVGHFGCPQKGLNSTCQLENHFAIVE